MGGNVSDDATCAVAANSLNNAQTSLGPLQDNGGCINTCAPNADSQAIDLILQANCTDNGGVAVTEDARDIPRPDTDSLMCDAGPVEVQPAAGTIIIDKVTLPISVPTNFSFNGTGFPASCGLDGAFTLADADPTIMCAGLPANQAYTISETVPVGTTLGLACDTGNTVVAGDQVTINLAADDVITCTFTNTQMEICNDGMDNNGDGLNNCQDPLCVGQTGESGQTCEIPETTCNDTDDNDGDGQVDCDDTDCATNVACTGGAPEDNCTNGIDDDGDTAIDCDDADCASNPACMMGPGPGGRR